MADQQNPQIDPELAALIANCDALDAELKDLPPEEIKKRVLKNLNLPDNATDAEIEAALQASVLKDFAEMSPEELAEWEQAAKESPLFMAALETEEKKQS